MNNRTTLNITSPNGNTNSMNNYSYIRSPLGNGRIISSSTSSTTGLSTGTSTTMFMSPSTTSGSAPPTNLQSPQFSNHPPLEFSRIQRPTNNLGSPSINNSMNQRYINSILPVPASSPLSTGLNSTSKLYNTIPNIRPPELPQDLQRTADAYRRGLHTVQLQSTLSPNPYTIPTTTIPTVITTTTPTINKTTTVTPQTSTYLRNNLIGNPNSSTTERENIPLRDSISSPLLSSGIRSGLSSDSMNTNTSNVISSIHSRLPFPDETNTITNDSKSYFARNKTGHVQVFSSLSSPNPTSASLNSTGVSHQVYRSPRIEIIQPNTSQIMNEKPNHSESSASVTLSAAPQHHLWNSPRVDNVKKSSTSSTSLSQHQSSSKLSRGTLQEVFNNLIDGLLDDESSSGTTVLPPVLPMVVSSSKTSYRSPQTTIVSSLQDTVHTSPNRLDIDLLPSSSLPPVHSLFDVLQLDIEAQARSQYSSPEKYTSPDKAINIKNSTNNTEIEYANLPVFGSPEPIMPLPSTTASISNSTIPINNVVDTPPRRPPFILGTTLYDFIGIEEQGELSFTKNKEIMINQWDHAEWWHGSIVGDNQRKRGWFPRTYVKLLQEIPEHWAKASTNQHQNTNTLYGNNHNNEENNTNVSDGKTIMIDVSFNKEEFNNKSISKLTEIAENTVSMVKELNVEETFVGKDTQTTTDSYSTVDEVDINNVLPPIDTSEEISVKINTDTNAPFDDKVENSTDNDAEIPTHVLEHTEPVDTIDSTSETIDTVDSTILVSSSITPNITPLDPTLVSPHSTHWNQPNVLNPIVEEDGETSSGPTPLTRSRAGTISNSDEVLIETQTHQLETALTSALQAALSQPSSDSEMKSTTVTDEKTEDKVQDTVVTDTTNSTAPASFSGIAHLPSEVLTALSMTRSTSGNIIYSNTNSDKESSNGEAIVTPISRPTKTVSFKMDQKNLTTTADKFSAVSSTNQTYVPLPVVNLLLSLNAMGMLPTNATTNDEKSSTTETITSTAAPSVRLKFEAEDVLDLVKAVQKSIEINNINSNDGTSANMALPDTNTIMNNEVNTIIKRIARRNIQNVSAPVPDKTSNIASSMTNSKVDTVTIPSTLPYTFSNSSLHYSGGVTPGSQTPQSIQVLTIADGRRIKVMGLTGSELVSIVRPKVYGAGLMIHLTKSVLRQKRLRALKAFALFLKWQRKVITQRRISKVYSVGLMKSIARWRVIDQVSPRIATLGVLLRPMRDKHEAMKKRAQVASKNSAILAGLEKGVSAEETLREPYDGPRTRGIHWEAMNADSVRGTIWDKSTHSTLLSRTSSGRPSSVQLSTSDVQQLLPDLFAKFAADAANNNKNGMKKGENVGKSSNTNTPVKPTMVSVLSSEVGRLLAISVGAVIGRRTLEEIKEAIYNLDVNALGGVEKVQLLVNNTVLFDNEKLGPLINFTGAVDTLVLPERFVKVVSQALPGFRMRLNVMEFMSLLPELSSSCTTKLQLLIDSVKEIMNSRRFATLLLDVILPLGNKLNAGSKGRIAAGFKISSLHKLVQTRAATGETFLQFIVAGLLTRSPSVLDLANDFSHLLTATPAALSRERVTSDLSRLDQGVRQIEALLNVTRTQKEVKNMEMLQPLLEHTKQTIQELKRLVNESVQLFEELARWLGEDPSKTTPETLLGYIQSFIAAVAKDTRDVKEKLERAEKAEQRKRQMEQETLQKQQKVNQNQKLVPKANHPISSSVEPVYGPVPQSSSSSPPHSPPKHASRPLPPSHQQRSHKLVIAPPPAVEKTLSTKGVIHKPSPPSQGMRRSPSQKQIDQLNAALMVLQANEDKEITKENKPIVSRTSSALSTDSSASPKIRSPNTVSNDSVSNEFFSPHKNKLHHKHPHPTTSNEIPTSLPSSVRSPSNPSSNSLPRSPGGFADINISRTSSSLSYHQTSHSSSSLSSPNSVLTAGPLAVGQILDESTKRRSGRSVQSLAEYAHSMFNMSAPNSPVDPSLIAGLPTSSTTTTLLELSPDKDMINPLLPTGRRLSLVMTQAKLSRNQENNNHISSMEQYPLSNGNSSPRTMVEPSMRTSSHWRSTTTTTEHE